MKLILGLSALVATAWCTALPPTTPSASTSNTTATSNESNKRAWYENDELDIPIPNRFYLGISSPEVDFKGYKFAVAWGIYNTQEDNLMLVPADYPDLQYMAVADAFIGKNCRFSFESKGFPSLYMDMAPQAEVGSQGRFKSLDDVHYRAGRTFDGFSMWHNRLVRRYDMNNRYQHAPNNFWYACAGGTGYYGEYLLYWDSRQDSYSPAYVPNTTEFFGCLKVDITITAA